MAKAETVETSLEYVNGVPVVHLGTEVDERVEKAEEFIRETAAKVEVNGLVLDYQEVRSALSRDGSIIFIANDLFNPRSVYLCNADQKLKGLELLGVLDTPGVYRADSIDEAVEKISRQ